MTVHSERKRTWTARFRVFGAQLLGVSITRDSLLASAYRTAAFVLGQQRFTEIGVSVGQIELMLELKIAAPFLEIGRRLLRLDELIWNNYDELINLSQKNLKYLWIIGRRNTNKSE